MSDLNAGRRHAVVIGAGIAGLAAARVLADHFEAVTLLERDDATGTAAPRVGVSQGGHAHFLLASGLFALERLFPGIRAELEAGGAVTFDTGVGLAWHHFGAWKKTAAFGLPGSFQSRPFLESLLVRRLKKRVSLQTGQTVAGLAWEAGRVIGVTCRPTVGSHEQPATSETLRADLVIDASGRGSRALDWLVDGGFGRPVCEEVVVRVGYATRIYEDVALPAGRSALAVHPRAPADRRIGVLLPLEGGRFICSLGGWHGDFPPLEENGFMAFARSLVVPTLFEAIKGARAVTAPLPFRYPKSRWHRMDRLREIPRGIIVLGDGLCSFNPLFGQGMSVALREAEILAEAVTSGAPERTFYRRSAKLVGTAWLLALEEDSRYKEAGVRVPVSMRALQAYVAAVMDLTARDEDVTEAFYRVMHLLSSPLFLMGPRILSKIFCRACHRLVPGGA